MTSNRSQQNVIRSGASAKPSGTLAESTDPCSNRAIVSNHGLPRLERLVIPRRALLARRRTCAFLAAALLLTVYASAQTLTGTVKNSTTGKPAAGDEVVLITLGQGM